MPRKLGIFIDLVSARNYQDNKSLSPEKGFDIFLNKNSTWSGITWDNTLWASATQATGERKLARGIPPRMPHCPLCSIGFHTDFPRTPLVSSLLGLTRYLRFLAIKAITKAKRLSYAHHQLSAERQVPTPCQTLHVGVKGDFWPSRRVGFGFSVIIFSCFAFCSGFCAPICCSRGSSGQTKLLRIIAANAEPDPLYPDGPNLPSTEAPAVFQGKCPAVSLHPNLPPSLLLPPCPAQKSEEKGEK